jgi:hypothetical protein
MNDLVSTTILVLNYSKYVCTSLWSTEILNDVAYHIGNEPTGIDYLSEDQH